MRICDFTLPSNPFIYLINYLFIYLFIFHILKKLYKIFNYKINNLSLKDVNEYKNEILKLLFKEN